MGKKSFEAGMAAGAKPFEEKFQKQGDALTDLGERLDSHLDSIQGTINTVLDDCLARERREVYGLNTPFDILTMDDTEKNLTVSLLYALAQRFEANEFQQAYTRSVQRYLELKNIQPTTSLTAVESVKDVDHQKAILQVVMEYLFLDTFSFYFLGEEEYEELFDSFMVNRKTFREVETAINNIYQAVGAEGLAEKYGFTVENEPENEEDDPDCYGLLAPVAEELIIDDSNNKVKLGEEKRYENLRVVITKQLLADGNVVFFNCEIVFAFGGRTALFALEPQSSLEFRNCEFIIDKPCEMSVLSIFGSCLMKNCRMVDQKYAFGVTENLLKDDDGDPLPFNRAFISIHGNEAPATLTLDHCYIQDCGGTFISTDGCAFDNTSQITLSRCFIDHHTGNFLFARYPDQTYDTSVIIENTTFQNIEKQPPEPDLDDYDFMEKYPYKGALLTLTDERFSCTDSAFINVKQYCIYYSQFALKGSSNSITKNCKFIGIAQQEPFLGVFENCEFSDISCNLVFGECTEGRNPEVVLRNSLFTNYTGTLEIQHSRIENCRFLDSHLLVKLRGKHSRGDEYISEATNVGFENCTALNNDQPTRYDSILGVPRIMEADSYLGRRGNCVNFNGCNFKNCISRGTLIYPGAFGQEWNTRVE